MRFIPSEKFTWLSNRWNSSKDQMKDNPAHDQGVMDGMFAINQIPGLVSIWSCEGHPNARHPEDPTKESKAPAVGYLMVGVRDQQALDKLFEIYERLSEASGDWCHLVKLTTTMRGDISEPIESPKEIRAWWPVWILNWPTFKTNKQIYFDRVNQSILNVLEGLK